MRVTEKTHDYEPEQDHEVVEPPAGRSGEALARAEAAVRAELLPALGIAGLDVFYVGRGGFGDAVALYVDGTAGWPVVGLDMASIEEGCLDHGLDLETQIRASLAHEIAHAIQEASGVEDIDVETAAEDFARAWVLDRTIDASIAYVGHPTPAEASADLDMEDPAQGARRP